MKRRGNTSSAQSCGVENGGWNLPSRMPNAECRMSNVADPRLEAAHEISHSEVLGGRMPLIFSPLTPSLSPLRGEGVNFRVTLVRTGTAR